MSKKLTSSVSISELLAMREQGLTNYQIAERLGGDVQNDCLLHWQAAQGPQSAYGEQEETQASDGYRT